MNPSSLPAFISRQVQDGRYWFLNPRPANREPIAAVCGGYECAAPDYEISRPGFTIRTVELVIGGCGTVELGGRVFPLTAGVTFTYGPGVPHRIRTDPDRVLRKYFLCVVGRSVAPLLSAGPLADGKVIGVLDLGEMIDLFERLHSNGNSGATHAVPICNRLAEIVLLKLADVACPADQVVHGAVETYQVARRHLDATFLKITTVEQAATELGLSPAYLARLFRRFGRTTPHRYLTRLRMAHAASVLMTSGCQVKEVADRLGYSDQFHFSRAFKAEFGVSPRDFVDRVRPL